MVSSLSMFFSFLYPFFAIKSKHTDITASTNTSTDIIGYWREKFKEKMITFCDLRFFFFGINEKYYRFKLCYITSEKINEGRERERGNKPKLKSSKFSWIDLTIQWFFSNALDIEATMSKNGIEWNDREKKWATIRELNPIPFVLGEYQIYDCLVVEVFQWKFSIIENWK